MDDLDGLGDKELIQSALRGDFELIVGYGEEHPGAWAGAWFDNEPAVRIVAAFTGDAARHDAALRPGSGIPIGSSWRAGSTRSLICGGYERRSSATLEQRATQTGRWILTSIGEGKGVIRVALRADQEDLASELAARYGSAIELRVGAFSFPDRRRSHPRPPAGAALEEQTFEGLEMNVKAGQKVLEAGDDGHGRLVLRNSSSERIGPLASGQPLAGSLLNASLETVGGYSGWIARTGLIVDLDRDDRPASRSFTEPPAPARTSATPYRPARTGSRSRCASGTAPAGLQRTRSPPP